MDYELHLPQNGILEEEGSAKESNEFSFFKAVFLRNILLLHKVHPLTHIFTPQNAQRLSTGTAVQPIPQSSLRRRVCHPQEKRRAHERSLPILRHPDSQLEATTKLFSVSKDRPALSTPAFGTCSFLTGVSLSTLFLSCTHVVSASGLQSLRVHCMNALQPTHPFIQVHGRLGHLHFLAIVNDAVNIRVHVLCGRMFYLSRTCAWEWNC